MRAMKAAVRDRYGPPDVVEVGDVDRPTPSADQVLVRVHAASVTRAARGLGFAVGDRSGPATGS